MRRFARRRKENDVLARGLTGQEAAALYGLSVTTFYNKKKNGEIPPPTLPGGRYDRVLLERAMDRRSGIDKEPEQLNPLDQWRRDRGSGKP